MLYFTYLKFSQLLDCVVHILSECMLSRPTTLYGTTFCKNCLEQQFSEYKRNDNLQKIDPEGLVPKSLNLEQQFAKRALKNSNLQK